MTDRQIAGHVAGTESDRRRKAEAIAQVLGEHVPISGARLLEVGTGTGFMAQRFRELVGYRGSCVSVDIRDERRVHDGYEFELVSDTVLPFEDQTFDIVVSNHVIEHVGASTHQIEHLREIARVLAKEGVAYVAAPNRYRLVEQHYRLPFLSWLPAGAADRYVRLTGRGTAYDVNPMTRPELRRELGSVLEVSDVTVERLLAERIPRIGHSSRARIGKLVAPIRRLLPVTVLLGVKR